MMIEEKLKEMKAEMQKLGLARIEFNLAGSKYIIEKDEKANEVRIVEKWEKKREKSSL